MAGVILDSGFRIWDFGRERDSKPSRFLPRLLLAGTLALALLFSLPPFARSETPVTSHPRPLLILDRPGLSNLARVTPWLLRGARPRKSGFDSLKKMGIRTVINLDGTTEQTAADSAGLRYFHIPMDPRHPPTPEEAHRFLDILADTTARPIFVHCRRGLDRTGVMIGLYRVEREGWRPDSAVAEMLSFGHSVRDYPKLTEFLFRLIHEPQVTVHE